MHLFLNENNYFIYCVDIDILDEKAKVLKARNLGNILIKVTFDETTAKSQRSVRLTRDVDVTFERSVARHYVSDI